MPGPQSDRSSANIQRGSRPFSAMGMALGGTGDGSSPHGAPPPSRVHSAEALRVVKEARNRIGQNFRPGEEGQCANFVRDVFAHARVAVGNARNPTDRRLLSNPNDLGAGYANSFAGDDVGAKVARHDIKPGDLVMYPNTYGDFRTGVITHVAIYVGDNCIIHRPTKSGPVRMDSVDVFRVAEIRRPVSYQAKIAHSGSAKCFVHDMEAAAYVNGAPVQSADIRIHLHNGHVEATVNGRKVDPTSLSLQLFY